jgi:hypothetical protein
MLKEGEEMKTLRSILLLPLKLVFGIFRLALIILSMGVKFLTAVGSFFFGLIILIFIFMFVGFLVFVEPGQIGSGAKDILISLAAVFIVATIFSLIPSLMDGLINLCSRVMLL